MELTHTELILKCAHTVSVKTCMTASARALRTKLPDVEFLELELGVESVEVVVVVVVVVVVLGGNSTGLKKYA